MRSPQSTEPGFIRMEPGTCRAEAGQAILHINLMGELAWENKKGPTASSQNSA